MYSVYSNFLKYYCIGFYNWIVKKPTNCVFARRSGIILSLCGNLNIIADCFDLLTITQILTHNMTKTLRLISTHRLDPEKWWDLILGWLKMILKNQNEWKLHYDIYGDWSLRSEIEDLARIYPDQIIYHGYVTLSKVFEHSTDYDFVMMPSHFIETFGLSSLDFNQFGIPTIGFAKGGLRQFVSDELDIYQSPGETLQDKMNDLMSRIVQDLMNMTEADFAHKYSIDKERIKAKYGFPMWLETFSNIIQ